MSQKIIMKFGTKAETLEKLSRVLSSAKILPQIMLTVREWESNQQNIIQKLKDKKWQDIPLVVRSSAIDEDNKESSQAGKYLSIQNVLLEETLIDSVNKVIESYSQTNENNQIFIQPFLKDVLISGVAFSKDPSTGSPYIVINFDDKSGSTCTVTSGSTNDLETFYYFKKSPIPAPPELQKIILLVNELEELFCTDSIDIEFVIDKSNELYLLQARPLVGKSQQVLDRNVHAKFLEHISKKIEAANKPQPNLLGSKIVYGIMPDWNPAEMIGVRPRPLALSLYKELITDNVWAYQRDNYGYRNLRSFPLLIDFCGVPYIDVRVDFNSFIPADIDDPLAEKLVNYYLNRLIEFPSYHDKVEFEIIFSCYPFDLNSNLLELTRKGFSKYDCEAISSSLRKLTNNIIHNDHGLWKKDIEKISILEEHYKKIINSDLDIPSKIYWLLEDCKRYGTLPFSGLARAAFVAVQLLRSLVNIGIFKQEEYELFMLSLDSISSKMTRDFHKLSKEEFLSIYGHLRPGTYDILSARYDETPEEYFDWGKQKLQYEPGKSVSFGLNKDQIKKISYLLKEHKLDCSIDQFFNFIKSAIEGREYAKFIFTRSLSDSLSLFKELGKQNGFSTDDCSYANISCISKLYSSSADIETALKSSIKEGKESYKLTQQVLLPPVITKSSDAWMFYIPPCEPNFVTLGKVAGHKVFHTDSKGKIVGNILLIPHADPGYDWVFSHGVAGLITMYGGANSHMAIRAAELGIPAAIGVGEMLYGKLSTSEMLEVDCANKLIKVIK